MTLFELLIALTIIIILLLVAIPTFLSLFQDYNLGTTTEHLFQVLQYARSEAIKRNQTVYAVFQTGDNWCYGVNVGASCTCSTANSCSLGSVSAPSTQELSLSITGSTPLQFEGTRGAVNTVNTISFTLYGQTKSISVKVNALGNMQLCSSTMSDYPACI